MNCANLPKIYLQIYKNEYLKSVLITVAIDIFCILHESIVPCFTWIATWTARIFSDTRERKIKSVVESVRKSGSGQDQGRKALDEHQMRQTTTPKTFITQVILIWKISGNGHFHIKPFLVKCEVCETEVGVFDSDEVVHFFNVVASHK